MTAQLDMFAALDPAPSRHPSTPILVHPWDGDACTCGHTRVQHKRGKRLPWPCTGARRGACTQCGCALLVIDEAALQRAEAAVAAARRAELTELLADRDFGLRYKTRDRVGRIAATTAEVNL